MSTVTKKELVERIAQTTGQKRVVVKRVLQEFLDEVIVELGRDNRLEFRDFGVFEVKTRQARMAQNPKTLEPVPVPAKRSVRFKTGRQMRRVLLESDEADAAAEVVSAVKLPPTPATADPQREGGEIVTRPLARIGPRSTVEAK